MKDHRWIGVFALTILAFCVAGMARAQSRVTPCNAATPTNAVCLQGTAPTTNTDGSPITGALTYRWEQRTAPAGTWASIGTQASLQKYVTGLAPGDYEWRAFAINSSGLESGPSNVAGRAATNSPPNAPVIIIAATIRDGQPPLYRIIQRVTLRQNEVVFIAPESMRPLFANR